MNVLTPALVFEGAGLTRDNIPLSRVKNSAEEQDEIAHDKAAEFIRASVSEGTRRAYRSDLEHYLNWGGTLPSSPEHVAQYLADHAETLAPATLTRRIATLSKLHQANSWPNPCPSEIVKSTMRGIKRVKGAAQVQAKPLLREDLFIVLDAMDDNIRSKRDRAMLLVGWAGAFRSSELVGLTTSDIEEVREGIVVHLRRSKTDQAGEGRKVGIPLGRTRHCPVRALNDWCDILGEASSLFRPVDRHGRIGASPLRSDAVSQIVRDRLEGAGIKSEGYSGHSLRAGLVTSAIKAGVSTHKVRVQTGHRSDAMLGRYIRDAGLFSDNASAGLL